METRRLGRTELQVTPLGYGLAEIDRQDKGGRDISASGRVLEAVLDSGINFLDTASGYGITEELIGETISHRRGEYVLATKFGPIYDDASARGYDEAGVTESIDQSLRKDEDGLGWTSFSSSTAPRTPAFWPPTATRSSTP